VTENTVYGAQVLAGCTVKEVTEGGKTWYQVIDDRGLLVTGGTEGTDYVYANGEYTLLTETPMTFTMRGGKTATQNKIRASADLTYNITLDNVTIDRSAVTYDDIPTYKDDNIIHIEKGNLNLTLSGRNILKGSVMRGLYADGGKEYGSDNTGILVERGKLTIDGAGSLTITEPGSDFYSGGIVAFAYEQKNGTVDITAGKEGAGYYALQAVKKYKYNRGNDEPEGSGDILVSKGTLKAVVAGGQQTYSEYEYSSGIFAAGNLTIEDANVTAQMGDTTGSSTGVYLGGDLTVKGGSLTATGKNAGQLSAGIQCAGDLNLTGGQITAIGGKSGDSSTGYGILVNSDVIASAGELTAIGGTSSYGSSIALYQISETGHVKFSGAQVILKGADADSNSYGGVFKGHMEISGGSVTAIGGKAKDAVSMGICNDTDSEAVISGGTLMLKGSDAALGSVGLFESSASGGVDLKITGGTIDAYGGKVETLGSEPIAAGIYVYNQLQILGGKIKAAGQYKDIDCSVPVIRGGSFALGDVTAGTVYGMKIASGCIMEKGTDADYPYIVKDPNAGSGQSSGQSSSEGGNTSQQGGGSSPGGQDPGTAQTKTEDEKKDETTLPEVGTKESAQSGNGTYEVTGTTKTQEGEEAAAITYSKATGKDAKTSKLVIPSEVTLEDGNLGVVTEIGKKAFSGNKKLTDVTLPDSVQTVKQEAFANCKKLKAATLGSTVGKVETKAFSGCTRLKKITVKTKKLTGKKVGKKAFSNIAKKAVVYYPKDMTKKELKNLKAAFKKGGAPKTITYKKSKK
jgi:hypothetical protein